MMWEACAARIREMGAKFCLGPPGGGVRYSEAAGRWEVRARTAIRENGKRDRRSC